MPGFGHGPFGHMAFGEWWWSRYVLYDLIPSLYKERDDDGFLEKFSESLRPSFDQLRRKMRDFGELRDPLLVRAAATETQSFRFGKQVVLKGGIEQSGVDGRVLIYGEFTAKTARFSEADKGKELTIRRSTKPENNKSVTIVAVVDGQTVAVSPRLALDVGPVRWNVRQTYVDPPNQATVEIRSGGTELGKVAGGWLVNDGFASFDVRDRKLFTVPADERTLLTERDGEGNGTIDSSGRLSTPTYQFALSDVGKIIFIAGSVFTSNNGRFEVYGVDKLSPTDYRAVFSRLDVTGLVPMSGLHDSAGTVRYANKPEKFARVQHVRAGLNTPLSIVVSGSDITVNLATDPLGNVSTTASALVVALTADVFASALVTVVAPGAGSGYVAATEGFLDIPGAVLVQDANLTWSMTPFGQLVLRGPTPKGLVEQDGIDGQLQIVSATQATLKATTTSPFRSGDVGKLLVVRGSQAGNDGVYRIISVPSWGAGTVVTLDGVFAAEPVSNLVYWEMRTDSGFVSDPLTVAANAPSMLAVLAKDFGIEVDTQESEARQRSWVKYINEWADRKGLAKAYEILAAISGYIGTTFQLYNISYDVSLQLPSLSVYEITDNPFFGEDGVFSNASAAEVTLTAPSALLSGGFSLTHIGRYVRTQLAASGNNNQLFEVIDLLSPSSLRLKATGASPVFPTAPDANNGAIRWALLRLYTDLPPLRPNFDDFDSDKMNVLIPGFTVDKYCWEMPIRVGLTGVGDAIGGAAPTMTLTDAAGLFTPAHVGLNITITGATTPANNGTFPIVGYISSSVVTYTNGSGVAEAYSGAWASLNAPGVPPGRLDVVATAQQVDSSFVFVDGDINVIESLGLWTLTDSQARAAFLEAVPLAVVSVGVGAGNSANYYVAFDPTYVPTMRVQHVNPGPSNPGTTVSVVFGATTDITVTLRTDGGGFVLATAQEVATAVDNDPIAAGLVVASVYAGNGTGLAATFGFVALAVNGVYRTFIGSSVPLALGAATLEYVCEPVLTCDFCGSYRVLLELELDTLLNEPDSAFERVFERTLERLKDVTPAHVELVPRIVQPITAVLNLQATIEPVEILAILYAPLSLLFDETPPDSEVEGTGDTIGGAAPSMTLTDAAGLFTEGLVGASGTGDTIGGAAPTMTLTDAGAAFTVSDVGRYITITGATTPANNGTFLISSYTSPTVISYTNASGVAEAFAGSWIISTMNITITGATTPANNGTFLITGFTSYSVITYLNPAGVAEVFPGTWGVALYVIDSPLSVTITTPP